MPHTGRSHKKKIKKKSQALQERTYFSKTMVGTQATGKHIMFTLRPSKKRSDKRSVMEESIRTTCF